MKKEFKAPEIRVKAIAAREEIMASGENTVLGGGKGTVINMYKIDTAEVESQYKQWKRY